MPRGQPVRRAGPRHADRREADRRVPPGPGRRPAAPAVRTDPPDPRSPPLHPATTNTNKETIHDARRAFVGVRARRFTGIWVQSFEHDDAIAEIARLCRQQGWTLATWDVDRGLALAGRADDGPTPSPAPPTRWPRSGRSAPWPRPTAPRCWCCGTSTGSWALRGRPGPRHRRSPPASRTGPSSSSWRRSSRSRSSWRSSSSSSSTTCPAATSSRRSPAAIATEPGELPEGDGLDAVLDAAAGLTRVEAENAFSLSLVRHGRLAPDVLWELKAQTLKKSGLLTLHRGGETFADLGGLDALKAFCRAPCGRAVRAGVRARGVLLLGAARLGQERVLQGPRATRPAGRRWSSTSARCMGSLVGQTESERPPGPADRRRDGPVRRHGRRGREGARRRPAGGQADSGVSARLFGTLLTWLNDHESDVFVVCTANDVSKLPPEFAGPSGSTRSSSSTCPGRARRRRSGGCTSRGTASTRPSAGRSDRDWTGAEIKACCRLAALLDVPLVEAAHEHRAGGRDGRRVGRAAADLGHRPVPVGRPARASTRGPRARSGKPAGTSAGRSLGQLNSRPRPRTMRNRSRLRGSWNATAMTARSAIFPRRPCTWPAGVFSRLSRSSRSHNGKVEASIKVEPILH